MSSPNDNTSPHARAYYDDPAARRRQLSSGPLGGICFYTKTVHMKPTKMKAGVSLLLMLFSGCIPTTYIPITNNAPLLKTKDEVHLSGSVSGTWYSMQIAYAPAQHIGVLGNGNISKQQKTPEGMLPFDKHSFGELGIGYFTQFGNGSVYEVYSGYGQGSSFVRDLSFSGRQWFHTTESRGTYSCLFFLQNYGASLDSSVDVAMSLRVSNVSFSSHSPSGDSKRDRFSTVLIEPSATIKYGWPSFKFVCQTTYTKPIDDNTVFEISSINSALGIELIFPIIH